MKRAEDYQDDHNDSHFVVIKDENEVNLKNVHLGKPKGHAVLYESSNSSTRLPASKKFKSDPYETPVVLLESSSTSFAKFDVDEDYEGCIQSFMNDQFGNNSLIANQRTTMTSSFASSASDEFAQHDDEEKLISISPSSSTSSSSAYSLSSSSYNSSSSSIGKTRRSLSVDTSNNVTGQGASVSPENLVSTKDFFSHFPPLCVCMCMYQARCDLNE